MLAMIIASSGFLQSSMESGNAVVALAILFYFLDVRLVTIVEVLSAADVCCVDRLFETAAIVPFRLAGGFPGRLVSRNIDGGQVRRMAMLLLFLSVGILIHGRSHDMAAVAGGSSRVNSPTEPQQHSGHSENLSETSRTLLMPTAK